MVTVAKPRSGVDPGLAAELGLDSLEAMAVDMAKVVRARLAGTIDETTYRSVLAGANTLTRVLQLAKSADQERRIKALEKLLERSQ